LPGGRGAVQGSLSAWGGMGLRLGSGDRGVPIRSKIPGYKGTCGTLAPSVENEVLQQSPAPTRQFITHVPHTGPRPWLVWKATGVSEWETSRLGACLMRGRTSIASRGNAEPIDREKTHGQQQVSIDSARQPERSASGGRPCGHLSRAFDHRELKQSCSSGRGSF